jgi:hypothetical protein
VITNISEKCWQQPTRPHCTEPFATTKELSFCGGSHMMLQQNDFLISYVLTWLVLSILAGPVIVFFSAFPSLLMWHYGHVLRNSPIPVPSAKFRGWCGYLVPMHYSLAPVMENDDGENLVLILVVF